MLITFFTSEGHENVCVLECPYIAQKCRETYFFLPSEMWSEVREEQVDRLCRSSP